MHRSRRIRIVGVVAALLILSATVGVGAVAGGVVEAGTATGEATGGEPTAGGVAGTETDSAGTAFRPASSTADTDGDRSGPLTRCFTGEGHPISIGDSGATIDTIVHLSVLTDPAVGNEFGLEAAGAIDGDPIVTLAAGVRLTASEAIADGFDPFAAFEVLYAYELRLPMFDDGIDETEYRDDGSPITSAAGVVPC